MRHCDLGVHRAFLHLIHPWVHGFDRHPINHVKYMYLDVDVNAQQAAINNKNMNITSFILRRLWQMLPTLLGVMLLIFILFNWVGGDPAYILAERFQIPQSLPAFASNSYGSVLSGAVLDIHQTGIHIRFWPELVNQRTGIACVDNTHWPDTDINGAVIVLETFICRGMRCAGRLCARHAH